MYSIVDIETTGGRPGIDKITEIAIIVHDGQKEIERFSSLINPECAIPYNITQLTGIDNFMVMDAPKFYEVARKIVELTQNTVFVAHNVRFDYSFIKASFKNLGYDYQLPTLCTVRLSRKVFPGFNSYSLGKLCNDLNIKIQNRHRALGDAEATSVLFSKIYAENTLEFSKQYVIDQQILNKLPPLLDKSKYDSIPINITGVYYFYNQDAEIIYIGKSNDIKKRITQHFSLTSNSARKSLQMKLDIADISFEPTGSELIALLLESHEIKKHRPKYNFSQKRSRSVPFYGIFSEFDALGYIILKSRKLKDGDEPLLTSDSLLSSKEFLYKQIERFTLCLSKCDLHNTGGPCFKYQIKQCLGACCSKETSNEYNARVLTAIETFSFKSESFFILSKGRDKNEITVVCIEKGQYKGFGFLDTNYNEASIENLRNSIKKYPHNRDIQNILCAHVKKNDHKIFYEP